MESLREVFYDDLLGLATPTELAKRTGITIAQARDFIKHQAVHQEFKTLRRKPLFVPITAEKWTWQIDLLFYGSSQTPIMVCVEITSRLLRTAVLKNKEAKTCAEAFKKILQEGAEFKAIETDDGGEFKGAFDKLLKEKGIVHFIYPSTEASNTALSKVERVNRTLRQWLEKLPHSQTRLHTLLPEVTDYYNHRLHSVTKKAPSEFKHWARQHDEDYSKGDDARYKITSTYPIGSRVRVAEPFDIFKKRSKAKWSKRVYTIEDRKGYSFFIEGKEKPFRAWELLPVAEPVEDREKPEVIIIPTVTPDFVPLAKEKPKRLVKAVTKEITEPGKSQPTKAPVKFIVEKVLDHRRGFRKRLEFLTKYKGFPSPSWQPATNFGRDNPIINAYLLDHPRIRI